MLASPTSTFLRRSLEDNRHFAFASRLKAAQSLGEMPGKALAEPHRIGLYLRLILNSLGYDRLRTI